MKTILSPLLHNELRDINEVYLDDSDTECLIAIKEILSKHGKENKFGVTLLHKHFDVSDDEILVESISVKERVLVTKPISIKEAEKQNLIQTVWCFSNDTNLTKACKMVCSMDIKGNHKGYKDHD